VGGPTPAKDAEDTTDLGKVVIAINVVVFLACLMLDPTRGEREGFSLDVSRFASWMFGVGDYRMLVGCGQWWRLGTAMFLHLDFMHIAFNCLALLYVIPPAAHTFGRSRSLAIYLVSGLLANVVSHYWFRGAGAGASGALSGMIAALAVWGWRRGGPAGDALRRSMTVWILYIFAFGVILSSAGVPIDNVGHVAGFVFGGALGWLASAVATPRADRIWGAGGRAAVVLVVGTFVLGLGPHLYHVFHRDGVLDSSHSVERVVGQLDAAWAGRAEPATLPETSPSVRGGSSAERLEEALGRLLRSMRAGTRPLGEREAVRRAYAAWRHELRCNYRIPRPRSDRP